MSKKRKNVEEEDMIKALNNIGFGKYVDAFKKGLEDSNLSFNFVDEESDEDEPKKKKRDKVDGKKIKNKRNEDSN